MNRVAQNLFLTFIRSEHMKSLLKKCMNNAHTWDNESWANVLHMFMSKRGVHKRYAPMYGRIAKLYWNENKLTRKWVGYTWKRARTGARQTAKVAKAFKAKRKGEATWHFASEAMGRLVRIMVDAQHAWQSPWASLRPSEEQLAGSGGPVEASLPEPKRARWGTSKFLAHSEQVLSRRAPPVTEPVPEQPAL